MGRGDAISAAIYVIGGKSSDGGSDLSLYRSKFNFNTDLVYYKYGAVLLKRTLHFRLSIDLSSSKFKMAEHPSFTLAGLRKDPRAAELEALVINWSTTVAVGGTAGYIRTRSLPSISSGLGLGASYAYSGMSLFM